MRLTTPVNFITQSLSNGYLIVLSSARYYGNVVVCIVKLGKGNSFKKIQTKIKFERVYGFWKTFSASKVQEESFHFVFWNPKSLNFSPRYTVLKTKFLRVFLRIDYSRACISATDEDFLVFKKRYGNLILYLSSHKKFFWIDSLVRILFTFENGQDFFLWLLLLLESNEYTSFSLIINRQGFFSSHQSTQYPKLKNMNYRGDELWGRVFLSFLFRLKLCLAKPECELSDILSLRCVGFSQGGRETGVSFFFSKRLKITIACHATCE